MKKEKKSFKIGAATWMTKNIDVKEFNNGDPIPFITDEKEWEKASENGMPACCETMNSSEEYGLLYNIYAIKDPRGIAPKGWRIPLEKDYVKLIDFYAGTNKAGTYLRSQKGWYENLFFQSSDFNGLPNGFRYPWGEFEGEGYYGYWVMKNEDDTYSFMILRNDDVDALIFGVQDNGYGYSVRCVKGGEI
jgi:uncharacterized protein (TIGR02145 family)